MAVRAAGWPDSVYRLHSIRPSGDSEFEAGFAPSGACSLSRDLQWLLELGVPVEEIARRAGRTVTAIRAEIETYEEEKDYGVR